MNPAGADVRRQTRTLSFLLPGGVGGQRPLTTQIFYLSSVSEPLDDLVMSDVHLGSSPPPPSDQPGW